MCTWPELHTCVLCMKRKSITENETTVNTPLNQFTYKLQKNKNQKQKTKKQQQIYLTYLIWKEKKNKHTGEAFEN